MRLVVKALIAIAALSLVGSYGFHAFSGARQVSGPPDTREEWQGRIDYRKLDRQLAALSLRPEMAGLAVAVVEKGGLRFVRTYGVTDKISGARVTPDTIFRWASVSKTATGMLAAKLADEGKLDLATAIAMAEKA